MDSIPTTPIPASDLPIQLGNNRAMSRKLSTRFGSSKDATYPDDIVQSPLSGSRRGLDPGMRTTTLQRNSSRAQRGSASSKFDSTMSVRIGSDTYDEDDDDGSEDENEEAESTEDGEDVKGGGQGGEEPVRMSLMALLGESEGSLYMMGEDDDDEDDDAGGDVVGGEYNNCCVCMVRHKGAAFVPCGHSFCRLCSRELWVEGANCPLCNNFILEILDIF